MTHRPVTTLAELLELDGDDIMAGYMGTNPGDPEPGLNRSRAYHHGWRTRMMDLGQIPVSPEHRALTREYVQHKRAVCQ